MGSDTRSDADLKIATRRNYDSVIEARDEIYLLPKNLP